MEPQKPHSLSFRHHPPHHRRRVINGVMTEEQVQVLQQQIGAYLALQEQLQNWYASSISPPMVDHSMVDPSPYYGGAAAPLKLSRRTRWNPTPEQLEFLEKFGKEKMNPNKEEIKMLASDLVKHGEITESNVYNWYQNRRARLKKKRRLQYHSNNSKNDNNNKNVGSEMGSENDSKTSSEQLVVANGGDHEIHE